MVSSPTSERSSLRKRPTVPEIVPPQEDGSGDHVYSTQVSVPFLSEFGAN